MNEENPPSWLLRLFAWICPSYLYEGILGDLLEQYEEDVKKKGAEKAKRSFIWNVVRFHHPSILLRKKIKIKNLNMEIFKSHLTVAFRSILKHRFYSMINILGLSFSIAFVFLSFLFIQSETSYDKFHEELDKIYRVYTYNIDAETGARVDGSIDGVTPVPLGMALKEELPAITHAGRYGSATGTIILNNIPYEETICMVDQDFLDMFSFPLIEGSEYKILEDPNAIILSQEKATKYFGENDPIGHPLKITLNDSTKTFVVSAVIDNKKEQSSIAFDILVPFPSMGMAASKKHMTSFNVSFVETWVKFEEPVTGDISGILSSVINTRTESEDNGWKVNLQPLESVHFDTKITGLASYTNPQKLWSIAALVLLILAIAIINFIALTTGHSLTRIKEMGLRKTLGTHKSALKIQLIIESFVFTLFAGTLGIIIAYFLLPSFNQVIEATIPGAFSMLKVAFALLLTLILGTICGLSQSALLVKVKPIEALNGTNILSSKENWINQGLVVLQFSISILLIVGAIAIRSQMNYIQQKDLGFDTERLVEISLQSPENLEESQLLHERFRAEALKNPSITYVGASMNSFQEPWTQLSFRQVDETEEKLFFNLIESNYLDVMDIQLLEGELFSDYSGASATSILVNEELVRHFRWENPLEQQLPGRNFDKSHKIIGVIKDFHFSSLHNEIEPIILTVNHESIISGVTGLSTYVWPPNLYHLIVRIGPGDLRESISFLEATWKKVNNSKPFSYSFIDDTLAKNYTEEVRWQKLVNIASTFAIIIAWMGLLGMMRLSVQKRTKEIGIRKVLGSSISEVTLLLSKRFLVLIAIANLIALPIAWWGVNKWLESFVYRIDISIVILLIGGMAVVLITMLSVGFQARRAANVNPVESLRSE